MKKYFQLMVTFFLSVQIFATTPPVNSPVQLNLSTTSDQVAHVIDDLHEQVYNPNNIVFQSTMARAHRHEPFQPFQSSHSLSIASHRGGFSSPGGFGSNQGVVQSSGAFGSDPNVILSQVLPPDAFETDSFFTNIPKVQSQISTQSEDDAPAPQMPTFEKIIPRNQAFRHDTHAIQMPTVQPKREHTSYERRDSSLLEKITKYQHFLPAHDKESTTIPKVAPVLPSDGVMKFKKFFVSGSDILSTVFLVLSRLSYVASAVGVGDYGFDLNYIDLDTRTRVVLICGIAAVVFEQIKKVLVLIKLKDELHLISYERKKQDNTLRMLNGEENFYSEDEIRNYLKNNNQFICLPGKNSLIFRKFALNSMCVLESFLGIATSFMGGISATFITSGMTTSDVMSNNQEDNRKLTLLFSIVTGALLSLDYYRLNLKIQCEKWIQNYERLYFYFVYICHIPKKELMCEVRYVPPEFISSQTRDQIEELDRSVVQLSREH